MSFRPWAGTAAEFNRLRSTALEDGGTLTIIEDGTGGPPEIQFAAGRGTFIDAYTDPRAPVRTPIEWPTQTHVLGLTVVPALGFFMGPDGLITETVTAVSSVQLRTLIFMGFVLLQGGIITTISSTPAALNTNIGTIAQETFLALGPINEAGNSFSANGANLQLDKSAGSVLQLWGNYGITRQSPHFPIIPEASPVSWLYSFRDGVGGFAFVPANAINPGVYDDGTDAGPSPTVPVGVVTPNRWTISSIFMFNTGAVFVQYGQFTYVSADAAVAAAPTEIARMELNPAVTVRGSLLRMCIAHRAAAADLSLGTDAIFLPPSRFGDI